jgi:hypothetical protein
MRRRWRIGLGVAAALAVGAAAPGVAAAAPCTVPGDPQPGFTALPDFNGTVTMAQQGDYLQIPFDVPAGTTAIRVRYCYDPASTLDIGLYEPLHSGSAVPGPAERRGWSGSAVRDLALAVNGFSPPDVYEADRKAFVYGHTTRAYQPGPIPAGRWTAELGLAALGTPTVDFTVRVETSSSPDWADEPYAPVAQSTAVANPAPGWYAGDVHVHGEQEPGNAQVSTSLDYGFRPLADGGAGLDFIGLVDHNNDVSAGNIGALQPSYPGKLVITGTEVTTYRGHYNSIGSSAFADFRAGRVLAYPSLTEVAPATVPATQFGPLRDAGGWTQVNHPTIFVGPACRGCGWEYNDAETDYATVDAIEIQNGPADFGPSQNPFTPTAIELYESRLAAGDHIAAVGSSDSHKADQSDLLSAPIGRATTVVGAAELSKPAIVQAIRDDHTYVKPYGNDGPDIRVTARSPGAPNATLGDTIAGPALSLDVQVLRAGPGAARPGSYELELLRDGTVAEEIPVPGDDFTHTFTTDDPGRLSVQVMRDAVDADRYEVYSSPVWFENAVNLRLGKLRRDKRKGTAKLTAKVAGAGEVKLKGKGLRKTTRSPDAGGKLKLKVKPKGKLARKLRRTGRGKVKAKVKFVPEGGEPATASKKLKLKRKRKRR